MISRSSSALSITKSGASMPFFGISPAAAASDQPTSTAFIPALCAQRISNLLSPIIIEPIQRLKVDYLGNHNPRLHSDEILIALSICAATNPTAALAMQQLSKLRGCEAHASVILSRVDENVYHKLGVNLTCEPKYQTKKLYHA